MSRDVGRAGAARSRRCCAAASSRAQQAGRFGPRPPTPPHPLQQVVQGGLLVKAQREDLQVGAPRPGRWVGQHAALSGVRHGRDARDAAAAARRERAPLRARATPALHPLTQSAPPWCPAPSSPARRAGDAVRSWRRPVVCATRLRHRASQHGAAGAAPGAAAPRDARASPTRTTWHAGAASKHEGSAWRPGCALRTQAPSGVSAPVRA